jgi:hypothetical protein
MSYPVFLLTTTGMFTFVVECIESKYRFMSYGRSDFSFHVLQFLNVKCVAICARVLEERTLPLFELFFLFYF